MFADVVLNSAVLRWWLALTVVGVLALPLCMLVFRRLPGRGLALSRTLGLLVVGFVAWLTAMFGLSSFNLAAVLVGCVALAGMSALALRHTGATQWAELRERWRELLGYEVLWIVAFVVGLWLRSYGGVGSAIQFTEKPMDLMILNSVVSSPSFPPHDLWLAGYAINYYYMGYLLIGTLKVLSGVAVGEAFNLGVATILALAAQNVAGAVSELIRLSAIPQNWRQRSGVVLASLLGVVIVLFGGNQLGALQRITGTSHVNYLSSSQRLDVLGQALRGAEPPRTIDPASAQQLFGQAEAITTLPPMERFEWWAPSRAVYDVIERNATITVNGQQRPGEIIDQDIVEFPFFSFYLGDLHPHMLALPWVLLALLLALNLAVAVVLPRWRDEWLALGITALAIGSLYAINSWDAPTYAALYFGALLLVARRETVARLATGEQLGRLASWRRAGLALLQVGIAALILFSPFLATFSNFAGQSSVPPPFDSFPIIRTIGRIIGPAMDGSSWSDLLVVFGLFLVPLTAWWAQWAPRPKRDWRPWVVVGVAAVLGIAVGRAGLGLLPLGWYLWRSAWRHADSPVSAFVLHASALGVALIGAVDVVYLREIFDRRINTVFKVYYQVWMLLGVLAAFAIWQLLASGAWRHRRTLLWAPAAVLLLIGALVYPAATLNPEQMARWRTPPPALDGLQNSDYFNPDTLAVAAWIRDNTPRDAVLASYEGEDYGVGGEVATVSSRATLVNWPGPHEGLWRTSQPDARAALESRLSDLKLLYSSLDTSAVQTIITRHGINYVIYGPLEQRYPGITTEALNQLGTLVFEYNGWAVYQVSP